MVRSTSVTSCTKCTVWFEWRVRRYCRTVGHLKPVFHDAPLRVSPFLFHAFRQVNQDRSIPCKSIHYESHRKPTPVFSDFLSEHTAQVTPLTHTY
ncbi:hypothetical protein AVEN_59870-1 [Araneus ventricosus]|uniref:Uncharacterized protein n=1 Tax=Araneus ventricosus TaxID=182803 RepID=A0A4Y2GXE0_ARAVE|nr:hypothetical protein AVEN_59870-1 [Araneus ventricosus]